MLGKALRVFAVAGAVLLWLVAAVGCETGFITRAAQTSTAGFLTSVFSTAVNEAIAPH